MVGPKCRPQFVLFGSSIVQLSYSNGGWGATLADIYSRKADVLLRGYNGWNSRRALQVVEQVFPKDALVQPSLVIVYFGGNDSMGPHPSGLGPHVPLQEYVENMRKIGNHLKSLSEKSLSEKSLSEKTRIIYLTSPPVNEEKLGESTSTIFSQLVRTNENCRLYSEACIELCKEMGLKVVDLWTAIQKRDNWMNVCFTDGIHFSAEGSKVVVAEIMKVVKEAEWEPSLYWKNIPAEFGEDSEYDNVASNGKDTINISEWSFYSEIEWA